MSVLVGDSLGATPWLADTESDLEDSDGLSEHSSRTPHGGLRGLRELEPYAWPMDATGLSSSSPGTPKLWGCAPAGAFATAAAPRQVVSPLFVEGHPAKLLDCLYLGGALSAADRHGLERLGITHVLNVADDVECYHPEHFEYLHCRIEDGGLDDAIYEAFGSCTDFVQRAAEEGGRVLLHCRMGINRSATIAMAVLMNINGWTLRRARLHATRCRSCVSPFRGNQERIAAWELHTRGTSSLPEWLPQHLQDEQQEQEYEVEHQHEVQKELPEEVTGKAAEKRGDHDQEEVKKECEEGSESWLQCEQTREARALGDHARQLAALIQQLSREEEDEWLT
jgi:hypothetical protein